jgi:DNA-binding transcriptional LysR family regulator
VRVDPKLLIDFAVIAEERSFTRAAARLRVAQPWLSTRLHRLEELLGFQLFVRTTRNVTLTDRGAELFLAAQEVHRASETANALALQLRRSSVQRLRIGAAPYTKIMRQRRELIERFTSLGTNTSLELETGWSLSLIDRLKAGEIDLTFMMGSFDNDLFDDVCLRRVGVALTVAKGHPFSTLPSIEPGMLAGRLVQVFTRSLNPRLWDDLYAPLIAAGARFVEAPEMAEGAPDTMENDQSIAAFFDFSSDETPPVNVSRIRLSDSPSIPFSLLRRRSESSSAAATFWNTTLQMAASLDVQAA